MLCRNRVSDYARWKAVFDSHVDAHREVGLELRKMGRQVEDPNNVFFLLDVKDEQRAREFVSTPEAAEAGEASGVIDGEIHFVDCVTD